MMEKSKMKKHKMTHIYIYFMVDDDIQYFKSQRRILYVNLL